MSTLVPNAVSILSAVLKRDGFRNVDLFDTTFYESPAESKDQNRARMGQVRPFDFNERNVSLKKANMDEDFVAKVEEFQPDLIAASIVEDTHQIFCHFMSLVEDKNIPTLVGGVFPSSAPEKFSRMDSVHFICRGEGEGALLDLCNAFEEGKDPSHIQNLWIKKDGEVVERNPIRSALNVNELPIQDIAIFEPVSLFRPMMGRIYRMAPLETQRGCPNHCAFCNSPGKNELYRVENAGNFFRKRSVQNLRDEIAYLIKEFDIEYFFIITDTFLAMSERGFDEFCEMYSDFNIPFFMNTRPETITEYRAKKLKEINCNRVNIGVEHGNREFRAKVVGRKHENDVAIKAFAMMSDAGISTVANNIIGYPDETRDLVFDSILLARQLKSNDINAFTFAPYQGTKLRALCERKGYVEPEALTHIYTKDSMLKMPSMSKSEIRGLMKTFVLYARLPKTMWKEIRSAEEDTPEGREKYDKLMHFYQTSYSSSTLGADYICFPPA